MSERRTQQTENITIRRTRSAQRNLFYEEMKIYNALLAEIKCERIASFNKHILYKKILIIIIRNS